jgi:hypothetical protein
VLAPFRPQGAIINFPGVEPGENLLDAIVVAQRLNDPRFLPAVLAFGVGKARVEPHAGWRFHQNEGHVVLIPNEPVNLPGFFLGLHLANRDHRNGSPRRTGAENIDSLKTQLIQPAAAKMTEGEFRKVRSFPRREIVPGLGVAEELWQ